MIQDLQPVDSGVYECKNLAENQTKDVVTVEVLSMYFIIVILCLE